MAIEFGGESFGCRLDEIRYLKVLKLACQVALARSLLLDEPMTNRAIFTAILVSFCTPSYGAKLTSSQRARVAELKAAIEKQAEATRSYSGAKLRLASGHVMGLVAGLGASVGFGRVRTNGMEHDAAVLLLHAKGGIGAGAWLSGEELGVTAAPGTPANKVIPGWMHGSTLNASPLFGAGQRDTVGRGAVASAYTTNIGFGWEIGGNVSTRLVHVRPGRKIRSLVLLDGGAKLADKMLGDGATRNVAKQIGRLERYLELSKKDDASFRAYELDSHPAK